MIGSDFMYERMLNKEICPSEEEILETIGNESNIRLDQLEMLLNEHYKLRRELKFPFGNSYGWGYKYSYKSKHLFYIFFEKNAFTVTIQLGDKEVPALNAKLDDFLSKTKTLWEKRYPCGKNGGWVHYRVLNDEELKDIVELVLIKNPAPKSKQ
jgi:hypothetical protein